MQSFTHSMAQRGASASRTNTRWHPYTPSRTSINSTPHTFRATPLSISINDSFGPNTITNHLLSPTSTIASTPQVIHGGNAHSSGSLPRRSSSFNVTVSDESEKRAKVAVTLVGEHTFGSLADLAINFLEQIERYDVLTKFGNRSIYRRFLRSQNV